MVDKLVVGQAAYLWEAIHPLADFHKVISVFGYVPEVVLLGDIIGNKVESNQHVFVLEHCGVKINFLTSMAMNWLQGREMVLFTTFFAVVRAAVDVLTLPG